MNDYHQLLILLVIVWTAGKVFRRIGLPVVFGELLGGVIVGPAMLGLIAHETETIKVLSELGILFLMLHTGLVSDHNELLGSSKKSILIAVGGVVVPFAAGFFTAQAFGQDLVASLFIAMGLSITAIALAARIFKDCGIEKSRVAHLTLGAAIIDDIAALILFSVVVSVAETGTVEAIPLLIMISKVTLFFIVVLFLGLKTSHLANRLIYFGNKGFTMTLIITLIFGLIAEAIGLHMIIGAFLAGLFIREEVIDQKTFAKIEDRIYGLAYGFLGPIFFASLAFHLDFTAFTQAPVFLLAIVVVAVLGKVIGCGAIAAALKIPRTESLLIGLAMNNRGAVELVIASIGLSMGIIDTTVFSILVIMAFVTTVISIVVTVPYAKRLKIQTGE